MEIKRDRYLEKLMLRRWNGLVKIITGIRRCGKSYLLFNLFKDAVIADGVNPDDIIEVKLDEAESIPLRNPLSLYNHIKGLTSDGKRRFVFIDEIQMAIRPRRSDDETTFYDVLNSLLNTGYLDVYITGSNSHMLSSDILTQFRGRGDEIRIHPLSFSEFYAAKGGDRSSAYNEYLMYGGMPRILSMKTDGDKAEYLRGLVKETYIKDIEERHRIDHPEALEGIVDLLCSSVGSLTNPKAISSNFEGVSEGTARKYLDYVLDAFMFSEAKRYDVKGKHYFTFPQKYYCEDVGLRNARLNFRQFEKTHLMENVIYNELRIRGFSVDVGVVTINSKDEEGKSIRTYKEIDFVANRMDNRLYIQSAFAIPDEEKLLSETGQLKRVGDSFRKIVVRGDTWKRWHDDDGILHIDVIDFLLDESVTLN